MSRITVTRSIEAPVETVFQTVSDISNFRKAIPHITDVQFLTDQRSGVGTRFRETRSMKGRQHATELEVTEYQPNDRVRMVADSHGTVWDTVFEVVPNGSGADLSMVMDARAYKLIPKLLNPLMKGFVAKAVEADMDAVKSYCEGSGP